jgi:SAM-dependent methyltransferase
MFKRTHKSDQSIRAFLGKAYHHVLPLLPEDARCWLMGERDRWGPRWPNVFVRFGSLRRTTPIGAHCQRGIPIDRYYIEGFLKQNSDDIRGRVIEFHDSDYTKRFGGERVTCSDVLSVEAGNPHSTFVGDLAGVNDLPTEAFDCVIATQVLQYIYDLKAAIATLYRIIKPGGVILATMPGITPLHPDSWPWPWTWMLTPISAEQLFRGRFPANGLSVETRGNILAAIAYLHGLGWMELRRAELDYHDPSYPVTIAIRGIKPKVHPAEIATANNAAEAC